MPSAKKGPSTGRRSAGAQPVPDRARSVPERPATPLSPGTWRLHLLLAVLAAIILTAIVWLMPRDTGDTYMALSGARDSVHGGLGKPDDWAFTTSGRVWINQNWGSDLLFYGILRSTGDAGLVGLKAVLLALLVFLIAEAGRERGVGRPASILFAAAAVLAFRTYLDLRPNLVGLDMMALMLLVLYRARRSPRWIWVALAVSVFWANLHGSFVFGLAMMTLWAVCATAAAVSRHGGRPGLRRSSPVLIATAGTVLLSGVLTPFGFENLTHVLIVAGNPIWRRVAEWWPILKKGPSPGSKWEFFTFLVLFAAALIWNLRGRRGPVLPSGRDPERRAAFIFDLVVAVVTVVMAFRARRFIPQTLLLMSPLLMEQIDGALGFRRRTWALPAAAALLVLPALPLGMRMARHYQAGTPPYTRESFFEKMMRIEMFPGGAVDFVQRNGISGRVLNEWRWEGYLRWRDPQLKLFIGGRAQAVYAADTYQAYLDLVYGRRPVSGVPQSDIHLVIGPTFDVFRGLLDRLFWDPGKRWAYIYCDGYSAVLADTGSPETRRLVEMARAGGLDYGDEGVAALSRALCIASPASGATPAAAADEIKRAALQYPAAIEYQLLLPLEGIISSDPHPFVGYLEEEGRRLAALPEEPASLTRVLYARLAVADILANLYATSSYPDDIMKAGRRRAEAEDLKRRVDRLTAMS